MLHMFDLTQIPRYLKTPPRQPSYRQQRSHADFLTNVPIPVEILQRSLQDIWQAYEPLIARAEESVRQLVQEKYGRPEWIRRRI